MKKFFFVLAGCLSMLSAMSQSPTCIQGCATTTVLLFDFDIHADTARLSSEERHQLFYIAPALRKRLTSRPTCLELLDGNEVKQPEDVFPDDADSPNLNLPDQGAYCLGEYLLTGNIHANNSGYTVTLNLETSISRKTIKTVKADFNLNDENYQKVAGKVDIALGSLESVIKDYELKSRETNAKVAFGQPLNHDGTQLLEIKPKKVKLQMGEETEVEVTLTDCDGYPLGNRTISFTRETFDSMLVKGSYGGTVSPSKIVTDKDGKATVKFKAGKEYAFAVIVGHYCFEQPCGRKDVICGSTGIDMQLKPYRVIAFYTSTTKTSVSFRANTSEYSESRNSNDFSKVKYLTEFYYAPREFNEGISVNSADTASAKIYIAQEKAYSLDFGAGTYLRRFHSGETVKETTLLNAQGALYPTETALVTADTSGLHLFSFALNLYKTGKLNGSELEPGIYPAAQVTAYEGDGHTSFQTVISQDPASPYKFSSIFQYVNKGTKTENSSTTTVDELYLVRVFIEK